MSNSKKTFVFTLDELIYESYKLNNNKDNVNRKSKSFIKYRDKKLEKRSNYIYKFADNINQSYIDRICYNDHNRKKNRILFISNNRKVYDDVFATVIDRKVMDVKGKVRYIIFMFAVLPSCRKLGKGRIGLKAYFDFIEKRNKRVEIILHSLKTSIEFYKKLGFNQIQVNFFLQKFEGYDDDDENFVILKNILSNKLKI